MLSILIILVIKQIRLPLRGRPILLITRMITYKPITYESGDMDTEQARQNSPKSDYNNHGLSMRQLCSEAAEECVCSGLVQTSIFYHFHFF